MFDISFILNSFSVTSTTETLVSNIPVTSTQSDNSFLHLHYNCNDNNYTELWSLCNTNTSQLNLDVLF